MIDLIQESPDLFLERLEVQKSVLRLALTQNHSPEALNIIEDRIRTLVQRALREGRTSK